MSSEHSTYSFSNPHPEKPQLSPFEQTLRDQDEEFYNTFPGARIALQQGSSTQSWHPIYTTSGFLPGCGFQLSSIPGQDPFNYPYLPIPSHSLSQATSQSLPSSRLDASHLAHQTAALHPTPLEENHQTSYVAPSLSPTDTRHDSLSDAISRPLHIATSAFEAPYQPQPQHHHQQPSSLAMDSLPSPKSSSDPSNAFHDNQQYNTSPQQAYYDSPPFSISTIPSYTHQNTAAPLSPPALVPATYTHDIDSESDHQSFFVDSQPSPQRDSSIPPSRRNSLLFSHRAQRRYSPNYTRPSNLTHKSASSGGATGTTWPPTSPSSPGSAAQSVSSIGLNVDANIGATYVVNNTAAPVATVISAPGPVPSSSPQGTTSPVHQAHPSMPSPNQTRTNSANANTTTMGNKRNPDKKPALACVFCRGRKIACGPPLKDGDGKTCNQCQRRSLRCEYPTESRRGMRKKPPANTTTNDASTSAGTSTSSTSSSDAMGNPRPSSKPDSPKTAANKKR